ncbi:10369_t:CDS:2, partial [Funneliformis caledonium]
SDSFPLRSFKIADLILKEPETDYPRYEALSRFIAYICVCYEELVGFLNNVKGEEMESIFHKWYHQQITTDETDDRRLGGKTFWGQISNRMLTIQKEFLAPIGSSSNSAFAKSLKTKINEGDVSIIFAIDEARSLTVLNERLDTVSKIANFLPPSDVLLTPPNAHLIIDVHQRKVDVTIFRAVTSAKCKLMGGVNFEDNIQHNPREIIIRQNMVALWCVRASLLVKPQGELASDLIANCLGVCLGVSPDQKTVFISYFSEPLVAEAAAQIINHHKIKFEKTIEPLLMQKHLPEFIYTYPLTVRQYLTALMLEVSYLKGQINSDSMELLLSGIVFFIHFKVVAQSITKEDLRHFFCRDVALQYQRGQSVIDHGILVLLLNGEFTCILIQMCNYSGSDPNVMFANLVITSQTAGLDMNLDWLYLILYFTLGYKNGMIKNLKVVYDTTSDKAKKTKRQEMLSKSLANENAEVAKSRLDKQIIIGLFGITPDVFPFLNTSEEAELLKKLSKAWTDSMSFAKEDEKEIIKRMMPLVWRNKRMKKDECEEDL